MNENARVVLTVPARPEFVDLVRLTLYGIASKMNFSYEEIEDMKVAVSEACNNVVLHAYSQSSEGGNVDVRFEMSQADELYIEVSDSGSSFQPPEVTQPANLYGKSIEEIQSGGLGLYLMQALMDKVEIRTDSGTKVVLTKKRGAAEKV